MRVAGVAIAVISIGLLTLTPSDDVIAPHAAACLLCGEFGTIDVLQNLALFVPLGAALALTGLRARASLLFGFALSAAVELLQATVIPGRDATLSDVLSNSLGVGAGALLVRHARALMRPAPGLARWLAVASAATFAAAVLATAALLRSSVPADRWHAQVRPRLGSMPQFAGPVVAARLGSREIESSRLAWDAEARAALKDDRIAVAALVPTGVAPVRASPILRIVDASRREAAALFQHGDALVFAVRPRARDAWLRGVQVRLPGVFGTAGAAEVRGERRGPLVRVSARTGAELREREVRLTPAMGWALILPWNGYLDGAWWKDALWLAALAAPVGYWVVFAGAGRGTAFTLALGVAMVGALTGGAAAARLAVPGPLVWLGAMLGATLAGAVAHVARRVPAKWKLGGKQSR